MNISRRGKIARLPEEIRRQLNVRLRDGEPGKRLVVWLNTLPEAQEVLGDEFDGKPISEQNLSDWRRGGYAAWLRQQEALEMARPVAEELEELTAEDGKPLSDKMAVWLSVRYLMAAQEREREGESLEDAWNRLREFGSDLSAMRRADHEAARLKLASEKWDFSRLDEQKQALSYCLELSKNYPEVRERFQETFKLFKERREGGAAPNQG